MDLIVLSIFPEMFDTFWCHGIVGKAVEKGIVSPKTVDIRDFAKDKHRTTDDRPFGGGSGMVMKPEPLAGAVRHARAMAPDVATVLLSPQGKMLDQRTAWEMAESPGWILVCGRYEGIDDRIERNLIDMEISVGDYVLSGGETAAMVLMDAVIRLIPGALGGEDSAQKDSFSEGVLEHAHYTRPRSFEGDTVPEVLFSGNHREIDRFRRESALIRTFLKRPDLLSDINLTEEDRDILSKWRLEIDNIIRAQSECGAGSLSRRQ